MRILVNFPRPLIALEEALSAEGCELVRDCWEPAKAASLRADACLLGFCDGTRHLVPLWRLSRALRNVGTTIIGVDGDAPWYKGIHRRRLWAMSVLRPLDIYASHSLQGAERFGVPLYLPNAAQHRNYHLRVRSLESMRDPASFVHDVSFLGNIDSERYPEHRQRLNFLIQMQSRLAQMGIRLALFDSTRIKTDAHVDLIQRSRINLNFGAAADYAGERSWGLPERCYGIPACGGFLLSDQRHHSAMDFVPGTEWVDFVNLEDGVAKIVYYLGHFEQMRMIAEAAYHRVMNEHTYQHRAQKLMRTINASNAQR